MLSFYPFYRAFGLFVFPFDGLYALVVWCSTLCVNRIRAGDGQIGSRGIHLEIIQDLMLHDISVNNMLWGLLKIVSNAELFWWIPYIVHVLSRLGLYPATTLWLESAGLDHTLFIVTLMNKTIHTINRAFFQGPSWQSAIMINTRQKVYSSEHI